MMHVERTPTTRLTDEEKQVQPEDEEHCLLPFIVHQQPLSTKVEDEVRKLFPSRSGTCPWPDTKQ